MSGVSASALSERVGSLATQQRLYWRIDANDPRVKRRAYANESLAGAMGTRDCDCDTRGLSAGRPADWITSRWPVATARGPCAGRLSAFSAACRNLRISSR